MAAVEAATTALAGVVFGLAVAAPPGPLNAVIAEESALRGWAAGFRAGLGAMAADACFLVLALAGAVAVVERSETVRAATFAAGGALMIYFAVGAVREARRSSASDGVDAGESRGFRKAFALALTNPFQIAFWLTVGVGLLEPGRVDALEGVPHLGDALAGRLVVATGSPTLLLGFFGGIAVWIVAYPAAMAAAERRVRTFGPAVAYASAAVLSVFGVGFLRTAAGIAGWP
jgi:threonine/homoserine/homoserine lactone efflux protein